MHNGIYDHFFTFTLQSSPQQQEKLEQKHSSEGQSQLVFAQLPIEIIKSYISFVPGMTSLIEGILLQSNITSFVFELKILSIFKKLQFSSSF
jgi:hypothetical protein